MNRLFLRILCLVLIITLLLTPSFVGANNEADAPTPEPTLTNADTKNEQGSAFIPFGGEDNQPQPTEPPLDDEDTETEQPDPELKYIFIFIGDGVGAGHLEIGRIFTKLMSGTMTDEPVYTTFPVQVMADGGEDSSQGGTMIATGQTVRPGLVAVNSYGAPFTTILDIAKSNGLATGVVTNASIVDATPATFLSHADNRAKFETLARNTLTSNVDFIAGGGLNKMYAQNELPSEFETDCLGEKLTRLSHNTIADDFLAQGYTPYFGLSGAQNFLSAEVIEGKTLGAFTRGKLPFYYVQRGMLSGEHMQNAPALMDMTKKGIGNLAVNQAGFVMMIEQALTDDASHATQPTYVAAEMGVLIKTLEQVMAFYNQHPHETLVIFTADHETGRHIYDEGAVDKMSELSDDLPWALASDVRKYLYQNLNASIDKRVTDEMYALMARDDYGNTFDNRLTGVSAMTAKVQFALGLRQTSSQHSDQQVPVYAIGVGADAFLQAQSIADIPHIICDVMDWENTLGR